MTLSELRGTDRFRLWGSFRRLGGCFTVEVGFALKKTISFLNNVTLSPFNHKNYRGLLNDSRCRGIDLRVVSGVDLACNFSGLKTSNYMP